MKPSSQETQSVSHSTLETSARWQQRILLILIFTASSFLIGHHDAKAQPLVSQMPQSCAPVSGFDGVTHNGGWGAQALIGGYQPASVCIDSTNWVMVNNYNYYPHAYDQIGYIRWTGQPSPTNENRYFTESQDASGNLVYDDLGEDTSYWGGPSDTFTVYYDTSIGVFKILLNGDLLGEAALDWTPNACLWYDETHATADPVLGGYNHHTLFGNVQYLQTGAWHTPDTTTNDGDNPNGGFQGTTQDKFYIWDTRNP